MKKIFASVLFVLSGYLVFSQSFVVSGKVTDTATGNAIAGAIVTKVGSDGSVNALKTDFSGYYRFDSSMVRANTSYILSASANQQNYVASQHKATITTSGLVTSKQFVVNFSIAHWQGCRMYNSLLANFSKSSTTPSFNDTVLGNILHLLSDTNGVVIELDGYCSADEGNEEIKQVLSAARATACREYLILHGVDSTRIHEKGRADSSPLTGCSNEDIKKMKEPSAIEKANAQNRRVVYRPIQWDYKTTGK